MANSRPPVRELRHATPGDGTRRLQSPTTTEEERNDFETDESLPIRDVLGALGIL